MKNIIFFLIIGVLLFVNYSSFSLSLHDFRKKDICPKVLGIPACYLVLLSFALVLLAHLFQGTYTDQWWYYGFIAMPTLLALAGSLTELSGKEICPRTPGGTPMCYLSLAFCSLLIILKLAETKWA